MILGCTRPLCKQCVRCKYCTGVTSCYNEMQIHPSFHGNEYLFGVICYNICIICFAILLDCSFCLLNILTFYKFVDCICDFIRSGHARHEGLYRFNIANRRLTVIFH